MKVLEDPFVAEQWTTEVRRERPVPAAPRLFSSTTGRAAPLAVLGGKLPEARGGRMLPHALMQLSKVLVDQLRTRGFDVLVVDPLDGDPALPGPVDLLVGELRMFDSVLPVLREPANAIWLGSRPHWTVESAAVRRRRHEVHAKRGFWPSVPPWELGDGNRGADQASAALAYDPSTYQGKVPYVGELKNSYLRTLAALPEVSARDRGFLWLGTGSFVRKGLDLALETFAGSPAGEHPLWVAGPLHWADQRDFVWHYRAELFHHANVRPVGLVAPASREWQNLLRRNSFLLMPSCAEGVMGALLDAMVGGLVPVVTPECGVPVADFGVLIHDPSTEGVRKAVDTAIGFSGQEIQERSAAARSFALEHYSARRLADRVERQVNVVLDGFDGNAA